MKKAISTISRTVFLSLLIITIFGNSSFAQSPEVHTTTGLQSWQAPAGVTSVQVECWGAGGAGGGNTANSDGAGGGGGGGYSIKTFTVIPGNFYSFNIGAGGTVVSNGKGGDGGETWFISNDASGVVAYGGIGGDPAPGGAGGAGGGAAYGTFNRTGGAGGTGNINNGGGGGGGGSSAGTSTGGNPGGNASSAGGGSAGAGGTAVTGGGAGGDGGYKGTSPVVGSNPGGGGGGTGESELTNGSKAGGDGQIILTYTAATDKCPSSNEIAPLTTQNLCEGDAATQLTATIATSGTVGNPTLLYQWYYNDATNSNDPNHASATAVGTNQNYTPLTTSAEVGTRYYFCVGYASDNNCGQSALDQSLASSTVEVTIIATPTPVTVSGGGNNCDNATLTASGGTGGIMYWQNTTSGGTSTAIASTSETVAADGTYYFRAENAGCWSTEGSATVTIFATPAAVTASGAGTFCDNTTVTASGGAGGTIYWQGTTSGGTSTTTASSSQVVTASGTYYFRAENNGCWGPEGSVTVTINNTPTDVSVSGGGSVCDNTTLTASGGVGGTIYWQNTTSGGTSTATASSSEVVSTSGTYYFRAENAGCWSNEGSAVVTVDITPLNNDITGPATVLANTGGYVYSTTEIPGATYTWTKPGPWTITAGQGTYTITVTSGNSGGDIGLTVTNGCGTGNSTKTISIGLPPDCPTSSAVTPDGIQTECEDAVIAQLTNTITSTEGSGTYTPLYQWYYNTSNSNTVAGATKIAGATSQTYTPLSTSAEVGDRWYFCVGYATDNTCAQSDATQSLASDAEQVTINPKPGTPTAITGNPNPDPSTPGLIYSTTSTNADANGYTWTLPTGWTQTAGGTSNSITVTSGTDGQNGDITVKASNALCGESAVTTLAVTATAEASPPTISLGANPTGCENSTVDLIYTATTDSPNLYSINYNNAAFADVVDAALPASPIPIIIPDNLVSGNYSATLTVKNSSTGLSSGNYSISVYVNGKANSITGITPANPNTMGYKYSIPVQPNATSYSWSLPNANWSITAGEFTNDITVTSGNIGDNGNVSVQVVYSCGTSTATALAVTVVDVVDHTGMNCSNCHTFHNATGSALTNAEAASDLCTGCHNPSSIAKDLPFNPTDQANKDGGLKNSHSWDATAVNPTYDAVLPTVYPELAARVVDGKISCSTCHDQHEGNAATSYLRVVNTNDVICKDCHSARNLSGAPGTNIGHHPVGRVYPPADPTNYNPSGSVGLMDVSSGNIECSSCHQMHYGPSSDGSILRQAANDATLCTNCHTNYTSHNGADCIVCHEMHNTPNKNNNIYLIKDSILTNEVGGPVLREVIFTAETGTNSFADGTGALDGICEICHTQGTHYLNDGTGSDQSHTSQGGQDGKDCMGCHPHDSDFSPAGGTCTGCHSTAKDPVNRSGAPQIVGTDGEFDATHMHTAIAPVDADCEACHYSAGSHPTDAMALRNVDVADTEYSGDLDIYCVKCHDATPPANMPADSKYDKSVYTSNVHDNSATNSCALCHNRHGSANANLLTQASNYDVCRTCHDGTGAPKSTIDIDALDRASEAGSKTSHAWDVSASSGLYETNAPTGTEPGPTMTARLSGGNIVCSTCHDPHDNTNTKFLIADNSTNAMCKDCHSARNIARYQDNAANKGSHPVGVVYTGTGSVKATPTGSVVTITQGADEYVECSSCHMTHNAATTDGNLLRQANDNTLCTDCHNYKPHNVGGTTDINCLDCHTPHNTDKSNLYMIRSTIATPYSGNKTVVFTSRGSDAGGTATDSYADGDVTYEGICEVCHTATELSIGHHLNDGSDGTNHNDGKNCVGCHPHNDGTTSFPNSSCHNCHMSSTPAYQYPATGSHTRHVGDLNYDCDNCHNGLDNNSPGHNDGTGDVVFGLIADDGGTPVYNGDKTCSNVYCHSNSYGSYTTTPAWNSTPGSISTCTPCHGVDANSVAPATGSHSKHGSSSYTHFTCDDCHNVAPATAYAASTHADGTKDMSISASGLATRDGNDISETWYMAPSYNTGTKLCSNIYCHSNTAGIYTTTPAWNATPGAINTCSPCHGNEISSVDTIAPTSYAHPKHVGVNSPSKFSCATCHFSMTVSNSHASHVDGIKDYTNDFESGSLAYPFGADAGLTPTYTSGTKTCNNIYCHSDGRNATRGTNGTLAWASKAVGNHNGTFASPVWSGTINTCTPCHNGKGTMTHPYKVNPTTNPASVDTDFPATGEHQKGSHYDLSQNITYAPQSPDIAQCFFCHNTEDPASVGITADRFQGTYGTKRHVDGATWFHPAIGTHVATGTFIDPWSYANDGAAPHCGKPNGQKNCWE